MNFLKTVVVLFAVTACVMLTRPLGAQAPQGPAGRQITFTKDVAPLLQQKCQTCHRPNSIAPMSLITYEEVRPYARAIKQYVSTRKMPPWTLDHSVGIQKFKYDRSLSDAEIALLVNWIDNGMVRGDLKDMPPPKEFNDTNKWTLLPILGEPDLVVPIPQPITVPAKGANIWLNVISESGLKEDRYIRAAETKPSPEGFPVTHHASSGGVVESPDGRLEEGGFNVEYSLGKTGEMFPEGVGMLIRAGTKVRFNLHYGPVGKQATDRTSVAFWFYPKGYVPKYKAIKTIVGRVDELDLPPGERDIRHDGYTVLTENVRVITYQPHMHNRGQRQCLEAIYPDGHFETLNCVNWDFGWHISYTYADEVQPLLPKGTVLHTISWHDNSKANKWNPDPENWVGWGQRTSDDMAHTHLNWYALSDEEFKQQVAARKLSQTKKGSGPAAFVD
jgi:hypothetical protein